MTVVGIGTLADEVLPDGVYFRYRILVSRDIAARYDCLPEHPDPERPCRRPSRFAPPGCGTSYKFYALKIRGGDRGVSAALDAFSKESDALNARLPQGVAGQASATRWLRRHARDERDRVERSTAPITTARFVLAVAAAAIAAATVGLVLPRGEPGAQRPVNVVDTRTDDPERPSIVVPQLVGVGAGLVVAVIAAWLLSPIAPLGTVRSVDPAPALEVSRSVWLGAVALAAVFAGLILVLALGSSRRVGARSGRTPSLSVRRLVRVSKRPEVDEGVRAAYSSNLGAGLVVTLAGSAVAVFLAALVFGASLSALTSTPVSYGWPWDVAAIGNFGFGGFDLHKVAATLDRRDNVAAGPARLLERHPRRPRCRARAVRSRQPCGTRCDPGSRPASHGRKRSGARYAHGGRPPCRVGRRGHRVGVRGSISSRRRERARDGDGNRRAAVVGTVPSRTRNTRSGSDTSRSDDQELSGSRA